MDIIGRLFPQNMGITGFDPYHLFFFWIKTTAVDVPGLGDSYF